MKISKETREVLSNFSVINKSILFLEGTKQRTMHPMQTCFVEAEFKEDFPQEFGIYELNKFLGVLSLFKEPDIDINGSLISINEETHKATYRCDNPTLIVHPPKGQNIKAGEAVHSFELSSENLKAMFQAIRLYNQAQIAFEANGEHLILRTLNTKEQHSDGWMHQIGESDQKFKYVINIENLHMMPHSYDVAITANKLIVFTSKEMNLKYYVTRDSNHSVG